MAQIAPTPLTFGGALGTGLGEGLSALAQKKLEQLGVSEKKEKMASSLVQGGLMNQEQAAAFSEMPPQVQQTMMKELLQGPQNQAFAEALGGIMSGGGEGPQAQDQFQEGAISTKGLSRGSAVQLANLAMKKQKLSQQERKMSQEERLSRFKETKDIRKEIFEKSRAARQNITDLDRMTELESKGKLDTPGYVEFLKRSGFDIQALMEPDSEEFEKVKAGFLKNAKQIFGARISNFELEAFLKSIPSLSQSPEGRKRVIANLKRFNQMDLAYNHSLREIMKKEKGVPPLDLMERLDKKVEKKAVAISDQFKKDLLRKVPKGQNKFITALQATAGSVVGAPGALLKKVGGIGSGGGPIPLE